jgi:hypothetical protein
MIVRALGFVAFGAPWGSLALVPGQNPDNHVGRQRHHHDGEHATHAAELRLEERLGTLRILGRHDISIASVIQKGRVGAAPIVMMTHEDLERNMAAALEEIDRLGVVAQPTVMLRVEAPDGAP